MKNKTRTPYSQKESHNRRREEHKSSNRTQTSWEPVSNWYNQIVGTEGHYFHQNIILPGVLRLLNLTATDKVLDLACGQGVLERAIPRKTKYTGVDISAELIKEAKENAWPSSQFFTNDASRKLQVTDTDFTHCTIILALQNIENPDGVIKNAAEHLQEGGQFLIVMNHPYFRIPKHSDWFVDHTKFVQMRRIFRYMNPFKINIDMNPGRERNHEFKARREIKGPQTVSFHVPLWKYSELLLKHGFVIEKIEEWTSDKVSQGKMAKVENRAREEFPMFMAILCKKT